MSETMINPRNTPKDEESIRLRAENARLKSRVEEAEWLIKQANLPTRDRSGRPDWWQRRDAWLKGVKS